MGMKEVWIDTVSSQRKPPSNVWLNSLRCCWRARVPFLISLLCSTICQSQEAKVLPETMLVLRLPDKRGISSISEKLWATQSARIKRNRCQLLDIACTKWKINWCTFLELFMQLSSILAELQPTARSNDLTIIACVYGTYVGAMAFHSFG